MPSIEDQIRNEQTRRKVLEEKNQTPKIMTIIITCLFPICVLLLFPASSSALEPLSLLVSERFHLLRKSSSEKAYNQSKGREPNDVKIEPNHHKMKTYFRMINWRKRIDDLVGIKKNIN